MCNGFYRTPFCAKCLKGLVVEKGCNYNHPFIKDRIIAHVRVVARGFKAGVAQSEAKSSIPRKSIELQTI